MKALIHSSKAGLHHLALVPVLGLIAVYGQTVVMAATAVPAYHELRLYTVTSNKMDGVLERFRDTVEPVRRRHGIQTVGYWFAPGTTNGGTFAYLMTAESQQELQRQEKAFGADAQFKEGYAASNRRYVV